MFASSLRDVLEKIFTSFQLFQVKVEGTDLGACQSKNEQKVILIVFAKYKQECLIFTYFLSKFSGLDPSANFCTSFS